MTKSSIEKLISHNNSVMRSTLKSHALYWYLGISFIVGIVMGYREQSHNYLKATGQSEDILRVLIPEGALPQDLIESFVSETGIEIQMDTYASPSDLDKYLHTKYDIALVGHTQVPQMKADGRIIPLSHILLGNINNLSADFKDLPSDPGSQFSIAVYWGVRSPENERVHISSITPTPVVEAQVLARDVWLSAMTRKPAFKKEAGLGVRQSTDLWVESFVILQGSNKMESCHRFINYFLDGDVAEELARLTSNSGTNSHLEASKIDPSLKPSHLRRQKLAQITRIRSQ